ncbi:MAG: carbon-nitrogen hydrolase family protein [Planctomycetota bacterium]|nr:carbon-nitrogen hydrolase family protein [Planctomycetota bacterium]
MKIAACQTPVVFGDTEANLQVVLKALERSQDAGVDVLCMPETFLQGYFNNREDARKNSVSLDSDEFADMCERFGQFSPTLLLGLNELRGERLFNTVVVIEGGELVGRYSKNYLVFNYFCRGDEFPVFEKNGVTYGIIICADSSYMEPARIESMRGAQIIFSPHFNYIQHDGVDRHTRLVRNQHVARAVENEVFVVKTNVVVPESSGTSVFGYAGLGVGDSFILAPDGRPVAEAGLFTESLLIYDVPPEALAGKRRKFHRASQAVIDQLCKEYRKLEV